MSHCIISLLASPSLVEYSVCDKPQKVSPVKYTLKAENIPDPNCVGGSLGSCLVCVIPGVQVVLSMRFFYIQ